MPLAVTWYYVRPDHAVHAFGEHQFGHGRPQVTTLCERPVPTYEVERHSDGPVCTACRLLSEA